MKEGPADAKRPGPEDRETKPHEPPDGKEYEPGPADSAPREVTGEWYSDVNGDDNRSPDHKACTTHKDVCRTEAHSTGKRRP